MPKWVPILLIVLGLGVAFAPTQGCEGEWTLPIPTPIDDTVDPAKTEGSWVLVFEETAQRTPELAKIFSNLRWWQGLSDRGLSYRHYDQDSPDAAQYKGTIGTLPYLLILGPEGKILHRGPMPTSIEQLNATVKDATGR